MAVKKGKIINLSEASELADDDRPTTTSLNLFNRYAISTKDSQDTVFVFFAGGYNLDGYVLLDSELNVRGIIIKRKKYQGQRIGMELAFYEHCGFKKADDASAMFITSLWT